jgi:hypothetical protein
LKTLAAHGGGEVETADKRRRSNLNKIIAEKERKSFSRKKFIRKSGKKETKKSFS